MKKTLLFLLLSIMTFYVNAQWQQTNGPLSGGIECFAIKNSAIYAGACNGGIYKSVDAGNTWSSLSIDTPEPDISALIVHNQKIFGGSYLSGIYRSVDDGLTWAESNGGPYAYNITCFASNDTLLVAGTYQNGILFSYDDGISWSHASAGLADSNITALNFINNKLFCGAGNDGVYAYNFNNHSWYNTGLGGEYIYSISNVESAIYAGTYSGLYKSVDNASSWNMVSSSVIAASSIFKSDTILLASTFFSGFFTSTDDGLTWQNKSDGLDSLSIHASLLTDSTIIIAVGYNGLYRSDADSINWQLINNGLKASDISSVAFFGNAIYANSYDNNLYRSDDYGSSWFNTDSTMNTYINCYPMFDNCFFRKDTSLYAANGNGLFRLDQNSSTWVQVDNGLFGGISSLAYWNNYLFAGSNYGIVYRSDDNGNSWHYSNLDLGFQINSIVVDSPYVYVVEKNTSMHRSDNFGQSWTTIGTGAPSRPYTIFKDGYYLFASFYCSEGVYFSPDHGDSWTERDQGLNGNFYCSYIQYGDYVFVAGSSGGISYTYNDGISWHAYNDGLDCQSVRTMFLKDSLLIIGTYGGGVWTRVIDDLQTSIDENESETNVSIFPNPATNSITVRSQDNSVICLFNMQGQLLKTVLADSDQTSINISDFANGLYIIKTTLQHDVIAKLFIKE